MYVSLQMYIEKQASSRAKIPTSAQGQPKQNKNDTATIYTPKLEDNTRLTSRDYILNLKQLGMLVNQVEILKSRIFNNDVGNSGNNTHKLTHNLQLIK